MREERQILRRKKIIWPALIILVMGALWLMQETGNILSNIPIGPFAIICIGLALIVQQR
jgi:hypothetical protein